MKLFSKIAVLYILLIMLVLGIAGVVTHDMVKDSVRQETDYSLRGEERIAIHAVEQGKPIDILSNEKIAIREISMDLPENKEGVYTDTLMEHRNYGRIENFRKLQSTHKINGRHYSFTITDVFIEQGDLLDGVVFTMTRLFLVLSLMIALFSFFISRKLLAPFQEVLNKIQKFSVRSKQELVFPETNTKEFKEFNRFLLEMTQKAKKDYVSLKEFSENASHEIQTPLAIARGKLELLMESENLHEKDLQLIGATENALNKLSRLGQSLALITKIENQEYTQVAPLQFSHVVNMSLDSFSELAELKNLEITKEIKGDVVLIIDESLAEILVGNLLKNAILHNIEDGFIHVSLNSDRLLIKNSGNDPKMPTDRLLERFRKSNQSSGSLGLGLSIVKQICDLNGLGLSYTYEAEVHTVVVLFEK